MSIKTLGGYVYGIKAGKKGPIKIGVAQDVGKRLIAIQSCNWKKCRVVVKEYFDFPYREEARLHAYFIDSRIRGEWYRIKGRDLKEEIYTPHDPACTCSTEKYRRLLVEIDEYLVGCK